MSAALKAYGILCANPGLEIWADTDSVGHAITSGRYVGGNRRFITLRSRVSADTIREMQRLSLLTLIEKRKKDSRFVKLNTVARWGAGRAET